MVTENKDLMIQARESLKGNWGLAVGTFFIYLLITGAVQSIPSVGKLAMSIVAGPFALGLSIFSLTLARKQDARIEQVFDGFKHFGTALVSYLLMVIFIILWTLFFIIPGFIAAIAYSQIFYILAEDDSIGAMDALRKSKAMMYGYKWKLFFLGLRFIGWILLSILTLGIGLLWVLPYLQVSYAHFYEDIKANPFPREQNDSQGFWPWN